MLLTKLDETTFELSCPGFTAKLDMRLGPVFREVTLGELSLPDWESSDGWHFPLGNAAPVDAFQAARLVERGHAVALIATYASADGRRRAHLNWEVDRQHDVLECFWELQNELPQPIQVDQLWPFQLRVFVPGQAPVATYLTGTGRQFASAHELWASEYTPRSVALEPGVTLHLDESAGASSNSQSPWLFLTWPEDAFTLTLASAWSGNWLIEAANDFERVRLKAGLACPDAPVHVAPGRTERLPSVLLFFRAGGIEAASNAMHRYVRERLLPAERLRCVEEFPTLNHMHYFGNPAPNDAAWSSPDQIIRSARTAVELGHFFFDISIHWLMGDNWADWVRLDHPTESRFPPPGGLEALCNELRALGLRVAAWLEPERVSLHGGEEFRERFPDGLLQLSRPGGSDGLADLGRDDIAEWIFEKLDAFITRYRLDGIFYDHNFAHRRPASGERPIPMYRYYKNQYRILDRLRQKHPGLRLLLCAGGGRRIDLGMLRFAHALQISDRIGDPLVMLQQLWAATLIVPVELIERYPYSNQWSQWQGDALLRNGRFLLRSALMGVFSSANHYDSLGPEALALIREHNQFYRRELVPIINGADVYRLTGPPRLLPAFRDATAWTEDSLAQRRTDAEWFALQEHNPATDRHAIFVFRLHPTQDDLSIAPRAVAAGRSYRVRDWDLKTSRVVSGRCLAEEGLTVTLRTDFDSAVLLLDPA